MKTMVCLHWYLNAPFYVSVSNGIFKSSEESQLYQHILMTDKKDYLRVMYTITDTPSNTQPPLPLKTTTGALYSTNIYWWHVIQL